MTYVVGGGHWYMVYCCAVLVTVQVVVTVSRSQQIQTPPLLVAIVTPARRGRLALAGWLLKGGGAHHSGQYNCVQYRQCSWKYLTLISYQQLLSKDASYPD